MTQIIKLYVHGTAWLWLFSPAYLVHIAEEYWGGKPADPSTKKMSSFDLTSTQFLVLTGMGWGSMILGILLAQRLKFPQYLMVILGTAVLANALSHTFSALATRRYNAGLISGLVIFAPLGATTLINLTDSMALRRYLSGVALGLLTQVFASLLASRGRKLL